MMQAARYGCIYNFIKLYELLLFKLSVGYLKHIPKLRLSKHLSTREYVSKLGHMFYSLSWLNHILLLMYETAQTGTKSDEDTTTKRDNTVFAFK